MLVLLLLYCHAATINKTPAKSHSMKKRKPKHYESKQGFTGKCRTIQLEGWGWEWVDGKVRPEREKASRKKQGLFLPPY